MATSTGKMTRLVDGSWGVRVHRASVGEIVDVYDGRGQPVGRFIIDAVIVTHDGVDVCRATRTP